MKSHSEVFGLGYGAGGSVTFVTSDSDATRRNDPGQLAVIQAREGERIYRYQKAEEAFAIGQIAGLSAVLDDADVDAAAAITEKTLTGTADFTAKEFNDGTFPSAYVTIDATAVTGQTRAILNNSANVLTLDSVWTTALTTSADYVTYDINYVSLCDTDEASADSAVCQGVAISAISDENWGWFQVKGFNPLMRIIATSDAAVRGEPLTPSGTAGAAKGQNSTLAVIDVNQAFALALHGFATADTAGLGVASMIDCRFFN
jgi:hypothetical protein